MLQLTTIMIELYRFLLFIYFSLIYLFIYFRVLGRYCFKSIILALNLLKNFLNKDQSQHLTP
jgi:hypothetical protein